jgi:hypothetical protein
VLISAIMSAAIERDAFDNRWFSKRKATQRIDPLVSLCHGDRRGDERRGQGDLRLRGRGVRRI